VQRKEEKKVIGGRKKIRESSEEEKSREKRWNDSSLRRASKFTGVSSGRQKEKVPKSPPRSF